MFCLYTMVIGSVSCLVCIHWLLQVCQVFFAYICYCICAVFCLYTLVIELCHHVFSLFLLLVPWKGCSSLLWHFLGHFIYILLLLSKVIHCFVFAHNNNRTVRRIAPFSTNLVCGSICIKKLLNKRPKWAACTPEN